LSYHAYHNSIPVSRFPVVSPGAKVRGAFNRWYCTLKITFSFVLRFNHSLKKKKPKENVIVLRLKDKFPVRTKNWHSMKFSVSRLTWIFRLLSPEFLSETTQIHIVYVIEVFQSIMQWKSRQICTDLSLFKLINFSKNDFVVSYSRSNSQTNNFERLPAFIAYIKLPFALNSS